MASNEIEVLDPAATVEKLKNLASGRALNRRNFMAALGMTGAAATMTGCSSSTSTVAVSATGAGQTNYLNFALNLEYLEATFYSYVTQGMDLPSSLTAGSGAVTGAPAAKLTFPNQQITDLFNEIYYDELSHVMALTGLLGPSAVARPAINLAALGSVTATNVIGIARLFEDVGITAYTGAASYLSDSNLTFAAQILGVESFHSGALRLISIQNGVSYVGVSTDSYDVKPVDPGSAAAAAAGPVGGGFFPTAYSTPTSAGSSVAGVPSGFVFTRTTSQILNIVYGGGGSGTASGGFFPSGVNGAITKV
jgi:hypothetical protein